MGPAKITAQVPAGSRPEEIPLRPMQKAEWFATWFGSPYYHLLYNKRNDAEAAAFADKITQYLSLPAGAQVLDIACGEGRLSRRLAQLGYEATGIDLSPANIMAAKAQAPKGAYFLVHDLRKTVAVNAFDAAFNFFTSFGYFDKEADDRRAATAIAKAVKPGGVFVMDYLNAGKAIGELVAEELVAKGDVTFHIRRHFDGKFIVKEILFSDAQGRERRFEEKVRAFSPADLTALFTAAGLIPEATFGNYELGAFDAETSPRTILVFRK